MEKIQDGLILKGIVHRLYDDGPHGSFALALIQGPGPTAKLTFSLEPPVWQESRKPKEGEAVFLSQIMEKRAGWQAGEARQWSMDDEEKRVKNLPLEERLAIYAKKASTCSGRSGVAINFKNCNPEVNPALQALDEEEKIIVFCEFIKGLLQWMGSEKIIGLTVSADGRQIKAWHGFPEIMIKNHAEGENCFMEIIGHKETVERYLTEILSLTGLKKATLPNGMNLYLNWQ